MRDARLATVVALTLAVGCGGSGAASAPAAAERCYPRMSDPEPRGTLPPGTTAVKLRMKTDRDARCRYSRVEGLRYIEMEDVFVETGGLEHTTPQTGLGPGGYRFFAKCEVLVDAWTDCSTPHDLAIRFSIAG